MLKYKNFIYLKFKSVQKNDEWHKHYFLLSSMKFLWQYLGPVLGKPNSTKVFPGETLEILGN